MRFSTQLLLLQLACVTAVVAICTGVFVWIGVQQLRAQAETSALSIARTIAADSDVRADVGRDLGRSGHADERQPARRAARRSGEGGRDRNGRAVHRDHRRPRNRCSRTPTRLCSARSSAPTSRTRSRGARPWRGSPARSVNRPGRRFRSVTPIPMRRSARSASDSRPRASSKSFRCCSEGWPSPPLRRSASVRSCRSCCSVDSSD